MDYLYGHRNKPIPAIGKNPKITYIYFQFSENKLDGLLRLSAIFEQLIPCKMRLSFRFSAILFILVSSSLTHQLADAQIFQIIQNTFTIIVVGKDHQIGRLPG